MHGVGDVSYRQQEFDEIQSSVVKWKTRTEYGHAASEFATETEKVEPAVNQCADIFAGLGQR
jgi:hypothetical protein